MTTIYVGASGTTRPNQTYLRKLTFAEIALRDPLPRAKVLQDWRKLVGEKFVLAVVAAPSFWGTNDWPLRDEKATAAAVKTLKEIVQSLQANVLVFRSPRTVRPGSVAFQRFRAVLAKLKSVAPVTVWDPQSVWEYDQAAKAVADLKVVVACDPLHDRVKSASVMYARLRGLGNDRKYSDGRLEDLAESMRGVEQGYVVFASDRAVAEAVRLRAIIDGASSAGGLSAENMLDDEDDALFADGDSDLDGDDVDDTDDMDDTDDVDDNADQDADEYEDDDDNDEEYEHDHEEEHEDRDGDGGATNRKQSKPKRA